MVWTNQANLNTARDELAGGGGAADAICMGGQQDADPYCWAVTEEYNGTSWASGGNLATPRRAASGGGNSSNAICMGGENTTGMPLDGSGHLTSTEEYNGTAWGAGGDLATARKCMGGNGGSSDAICVGGFWYAEDPEEISYIYDDTEEYNGTAWSAGGNLATARYGLAAGGSSSGAICMGGYEDVAYWSLLTEEYNGSTWSAGGNLSMAREGLAGGGNATDAICFGGFDGYYVGRAEVYDGTSWSNTFDLGPARWYLAGNGNSAGAISMGGRDGGGYSVATETWTSAPPVPRFYAIWI